MLNTSLGVVKIRLFWEQAPRHVEKFQELCREGLYAGTYFHRVAPGYLIQGGDLKTKDDNRDNDGRLGQTGDGAGGRLRLEISNLRHRRGSVSMARGKDPESARSQFFIMIRGDSSLDGRYSVFGQVVEGMNVVEAISEQPGVPYPELGGVNPDDPQIIQSCSLESWGQNVEAQGPGTEDSFE